jgi:hypothetical protein
MSRIAQINLRVRPSLKAKLEKLAKQDRRSLSGYIEKLLDDHVKSVSAAGANTGEISSEEAPRSTL